MTASAFRTIQDDPTSDGSIICGTEPARASGALTGRELAGAGWDPGDRFRPGLVPPLFTQAGALRNFYSHREKTGACSGPSRWEGCWSQPTGGDLLIDVSDDDIHYVTGHPTQTDLLTALGWASLDRDRSRQTPPPLGGVGRSEDSGRTWTKFHADYTRAVIVPPARHDLLLTAPAQRVGALGKSRVSSDGGESWEAAGNGLESPMDDMVELFVPAPDDTIWAVCSGGRLLFSEPGPWLWSPFGDQRSRPKRSPS
ncbi:MAG: hypothetical protein R2849_06080 [Thermomicrobiales bacterium]